MRLRQHAAEPVATTVGTPADDSTDQQELRDRGAALLAAADEAIARALSRDSALFLRQNRQQGGQ